MTEQWRDIPDSEGKYQVSDKGRVSSSKYFGKVRLLSIWCDGRYMRVKLHINGKGTSSLVHVLVMAAFFGPKPVGCECNHIDGNKQNNGLSNLEYVTHLENVRHAERTGLRKPAMGESHGESKLTEDSVRRIRQLYDSNEASCVQLAQQFGVTLQQVWKIAKRRAWLHVE